MVDTALAERLRVALDLADAGIRIMRQNLRRMEPDAPAERIEQLLTEWVNRRPGAEWGDCPGPRRPLPGV